MYEKYAVANILKLIISEYRCFPHLAIFFILVFLGASAPASAESASSSLVDDVITSLLSDVITSIRRDHVINKSVFYQKNKNWFLANIFVFLFWACF